MAQSEAGKSAVRTVTNNEEEEEFGPQLITKLQVCIEFFFFSRVVEATCASTYFNQHTFCTIDFIFCNEIGKWHHTG